MHICCIWWLVILHWSPFLFDLTTKLFLYIYVNQQIIIRLIISSRNRFAYLYQYYLYYNYVFTFFCIFLLIVGLKSLPRCEKLNNSMFWESFSMQLSERWLDTKCIILLKPLINCLLYFKFPCFLLFWAPNKEHEFFSRNLISKTKFSKKNNRVTKLNNTQSLSYISVANYVFQRLTELFSLAIYDYRPEKIRFIKKLSFWYQKSNS